MSILDWPTGVSASREFTANMNPANSVTTVDSADSQQNGFENCD